MSNEKQLRDAGIRMAINQRAGALSRLAFDPIRQDLRSLARELAAQGKSSEEVIELIDHWGDGKTFTWSVVGRPRA